MDLLIVFVHYQYLEAAVRNALPMIDKHTMILCLQNGLGNYDEIAKVVPEEQIIIGNTAFGSTPVAPGHVKHTGTGVTNMGSLKAPMAKVEEMAEGLRAAGLEVQVHENVMNAIWHKLLARPRTALSTATSTPTRRPACWSKRPSSWRTPAAARSTMTPSWSTPMRSLA